MLVIKLLMGRGRVLRVIFILYSCEKASEKNKLVFTCN